MALAYQSKQDAGTSAGTNITVTKPASTAAGNLLVAILACIDSTATWTGLDGFTSILTTSNASSGVLTIAVKIATGSETDPISFDTNANGSGDAKLATVLRFTGNRQGTSTAISASAGQANSASTTITAPTVTPTFADNILLFVGIDQGGSGGNDTSGYAVATNNPSWTEISDTTHSNLHVAIAYSAIRPETTATGSGTATITDNVASIGQLLIISGMPTISATDTVVTSEVVRGSLGIYIQDIIATTDSVTALAYRMWTNITRNIKSWTNQNKD